MKKLLGAALSAALVFPPGLASAELLKNLKVGGQIDIQANSAINVSDFHTTAPATSANVNDRLGDAITRVLLNANWDLLDDVHAKVTLRKNDRAWGSAAGGTGQGADAGQSQSITAAGAGILGNTYVNESYIKIDKVFGHPDFTVGRQFYGNSGDLVVAYGPKDNYGLFVTAIDAFRVDCAHDWGNITGIAGKVTGPAAIGGLPEAGVDLRGLEVSFKNLPIAATARLYDRVTHNTGQLGNPGGFNDNLWLYGLKLRGEARGGWLGLELYQNAGENRGAAGTTSANYSGRAFLADAGYKADIANVGGLTPWGTFGIGTGRGDALSNKNDGFTAIATDFRPGIINRRFSQTVAGATLGGAGFGGLVPTAGLTNRVVYGLGVKFNPARLSKLTAGAQLWSYNLQKNTANSAITDPNTGAAKGGKHIGSEYGITVDWQHSDNVSMGVGWADYQAGNFIINQAPAGHDPVRLMFADLSVKF